MFVATPIRRGMGDPTLLQPGEQAVLQNAGNQVLDTLFQLSMPVPGTTPQYSANLVYNAPNPQVPGTPPQPSGLSQWWKKPSAISDSLSNGNLVEIGGIFLGSMLLIGMVRRRK